MTSTPDQSITVAMSVPTTEENGTVRWKANGILHREDGPAVELNSGEKSWWQHGQLHREDGPAAEWPEGEKRWYRHGKLHREDGPALERGDGVKMWLRHGERHREDGPAIEYSDGTGNWFLNGEEYTRVEWLRGVVGSRPLTTHQRELLDALSENWEGTPDSLYETVTHLAR